MSEFLGLTAFAVVALSVCLLGRWRPRIALPLAVAFSVRLAVSLWHHYVTPLPGGTADAVVFEQLAWLWAQQGFLFVLEQFSGPSSTFYSVLLGAVYAVTGRSPLMGSAISVGAALGAIVFTYHLTERMWSERAAVKATWLVAVFPTLVLYSVFTRREAFVYLAVAAGLYYAAQWGFTDRLRHLFLSLAAFVAGVFFHTGLFMGVAGLMLAVLGRHGRGFVSRALRGHVAVAGILISVVLVSGALAYTAAGVSLRGIGSVEQMVEAERAIAHAHRRARDDAAYPSWMLPRRTVDLTWNVPARAVYFFFAPFPWDVRRVAHLHGLFDAVLYMLLLGLTWANRAAIKRNPGARVVAIVLIPLVLIFAMGTGNFGNGLRHRAKFVLGIIALAAPRLRLVVLRRGSRRQTVRRIGPSARAEVAGTS